jgi:hypothetical protein
MAFLWRENNSIIFVFHRQVLCLMVGSASSNKGGNSLGARVVTFVSSGRISHITLVSGYYIGIELLDWNDGNETCLLMSDWKGGNV